MTSIAQLVKAEKEVEQEVETMIAMSAKIRKEIFKMQTEFKVLQGLAVKTTHHKIIVPPVNHPKRRGITSDTIKRFRHSHHLTQKLFAKLLGVSGQAVWSMENKRGHLRLRKKTLLSFKGIRKLDNDTLHKLVESPKALVQDQIAA